MSKEILIEPYNRIRRDEVDTLVSAAMERLSRAIDQWKSKLQNTS